MIRPLKSLSEKTAPNGKGADAYRNHLSDGFIRWTIGSPKTNGKKNWIEGEKEWFYDGWRVSNRDQENLEILIMGNYAHVRRIMVETYLGPKGETSKSKAALVEIWIKANDQWLLYRVNVLPMDNK